MLVSVSILQITVLLVVLVVIGTRPGCANAADNPLQTRTRLDIKLIIFFVSVSSLHEVSLRMIRSLRLLSICSTFGLGLGLGYSLRLSACSTFGHDSSRRSSMATWLGLGLGLVLR